MRCSFFMTSVPVERMGAEAVGPKNEDRLLGRGLEIFSAVPVEAKIPKE